MKRMLKDKLDFFLVREKEVFASSGNRTRAARVAGEHSTTEPTMLAGQISYRTGAASAFYGEKVMFLRHFIGFI